MNKTQTEKDGELEKEEKNIGKKSTKQENNGKEKQKSDVSRFPRVRCKVDVILGRCVHGDASLWSSGSLTGNMG